MGNFFERHRSSTSTHGVNLLTRKCVPPARCFCLLSSQQLLTFTLAARRSKKWLPKQHTLLQIADFAVLDFCFNRCTKQQKYHPQLFSRFAQKKRFHRCSPPTFSCLVSPPPALSSATASCAQHLQPHAQLGFTQCHCRSARLNSRRRRCCDNKQRVVRKHHFEPENPSKC